MEWGEFVPSGMKKSSPYRKHGICNTVRKSICKGLIGTYRMIGSSKKEGYLTSCLRNTVFTER